MNKRAIFASITSMFLVFTYFSLPTLRELYGESALLVTYGGISILCGIMVYIIFERVSKLTSSNHTNKNEHKNNESDQNSNNGNVEDNIDDKEIVDTEIDTLKDNN